MILKFYASTVIASLLSELLITPKRLKYYSNYRVTDSLVSALVIGLIPGLNILNVVTTLLVTFSKTYLDKWIEVVKEVDSKN